MNEEMILELLLTKTRAIRQLTEVAQRAIALLGQLKAGEISIEQVEVKPDGWTVHPKPDPNPAMVATNCDGNALEIK